MILSDLLANKWTEVQSWRGDKGFTKKQNRHCHRDQVPLRLGIGLFLACLTFPGLGLGCLGLKRYGLGLALLGFAWPGATRLGLAWLGLVWLGLAWLCSAALAGCVGLAALACR